MTYFEKNHIAILGYRSAWKLLPTYEERVYRQQVCRHALARLRHKRTWFRTGKQFPISSQNSLIFNQSMQRSNHGGLPHSTNLAKMEKKIKKHRKILYNIFIQYFYGKKSTTHLLACSLALLKDIFCRFIHMTFPIPRKVIYNINFLIGF